MKKKKTKKRTRAKKQAQKKTLSREEILELIANTKNLVTTDIPERLAKQGIKALYDNIPPGCELRVGKLVFMYFEKELCEKFLVTAKAKTDPDPGK